MKVFAITWRDRAPNGGLVFLSANRRQGRWTTCRNNAKAWKTKTGATKAMLRMYSNGASEGSLRVREVERARP